MTGVLKFTNVSFKRDGKTILDGFNWEVKPDERWIVLGPNGAGKSTILALAAASAHPSSGDIEVLGTKIGQVNVFDLRAQIGIVNSQTERQLPATETVHNAVMTAAYGVHGRWKEEYESIDERQADRSLNDFDLRELADRQFGTLSDGERRRVLIARSVMCDPELLLLDEPTASLDLGARERLVQLLGAYSQSPYAPAMIMVTHHVEEIPAGFTHLLLLDADGKAVAQGAIGVTLTPQNLERAFGLSFTVSQENGRYHAVASV